MVDTVSDAETTTSKTASPAGESQNAVTQQRGASRALDTYGGKVQLRWDPDAAVTAYGQMPYFIEFLKTAGLFDDWVAACPLDYRSPNAPDERDVLGTLLQRLMRSGIGNGFNPKKVDVRRGHKRAGACWRDIAATPTSARSAAMA